MIELTAVCLALVCVVVIQQAQLHRERTNHDSAILEILSRQGIERQELINQVKHPGYLSPVARAEDHPTQAEDPADIRRRAAYARVGTVGEFTSEDTP